ncbi:unnamed protein product [Rhizophagus irregularis]|nr:unnamed protein product [Rhizophagus irregularis]
MDSDNGESQHTSDNEVDQSKATTPRRLNPDYKNNKKANCNYCHKTYICSAGTTSGISKHLKKFHATKLLTEAKIPSADTIKNKIMTYYEEDKVKMKALLKDLSEWNLQNIIIDFIQTQDLHTGSNIKDAFLLGISNMSLESKIMGITTDNASNNSTFMTSLSIWAAENVVNFNKKEQHIRCFAHSINLSVKEALSCLDGSHYPTLSLTVPLYNILIDHVEDVIGNDKEDDDDDDDDEENEENNEENNGENDDDEKWNQIVKKAAKKCKVKLLEYYNKTNDTYLISTILDLKLKLKYYKDHNWEETLVNTIYQKFVNIYNKFYASTKPEVLNNTSEIKGKSVMSHVFKWRNIEYIDEIQTYLSLSLMNEETDPLEWWKVNESQFPHLLQMARDYLPIPATSVPSEQSFSVGKNLITDKRNCLAGKTIRICMCLQSWWITFLSE